MVTNGVLTACMKLHSCIFIETCVLCICVKIFEGLRLISPAVPNEAVLLTPNILTEIHTNR